MHTHRWRLLISVGLSIGIIILAYINRHHIQESFSLLRQIQPIWIVLALTIELVSFFVASQVYHRVLHSLGYKLGIVRIWATALVAIVVSQSVPAGGVASYAFLMQSFRRSGIPSGHSALLASLEALSYAAAMLLFFVFSIFYIAAYSTGGTPEGTMIAAGVGTFVISGAVYVLTRDQEMLADWLLKIKNTIARILRRNWSDGPILRIVEDLACGRSLIITRRSEVLRLIGIQLCALCGHSIALLIVLHSLGATTSIFVVMSAFGVALISSTFNVLPGGGGTVEAAVVLSLQSLGVGNEAISAAVIFRLLNFWLLIPVVAICYRWIMHGSAVQATTVVSAEQ
ncbi:MAG: UPF0104 family protein [Chloroflexi bacterium AL-W]|nr:UPF0104 family protein [Chloroflexi bacterium AL-N1]NOK68833.1 UPF0104 family protein [Chloroflexi bacterium AL-N10]NOK76817.1 UPF0104 family protein [Chloroflexi bacterium AL-N5]NOK82796.1 UPF0104 family protein [Chloroflexi bacterium AL-W]NOK90674.1 UPF0104 family protein [Chloroflexi bacterium AL-N15]